MARTIVVLACLLFFPALLWSAPVASLTALEGEVTVLRSGVVIPSEKLSEGFAVEAFDTVTTGVTGRADLRLPASAGVSGTVHLDPSTSLYLDLSTLRREQAVGVELLVGSVTARVSSTGTSTLEVRTASGTFSSPGPLFRVVDTPGGDVLVTSAAGRVVCHLPNRTVFIEPGSILQVLVLEQVVQTLPMNVSTLDAFEQTWIKQRQQTFKDQAVVAFRNLASRYQLQVGLFQRAWDRVQREASDVTGSRASTANLRRAAFPLERSLFGIQALRVLFIEGSLSPTVELSRGYPAREFFRQVALDEPLWSRLGAARGLYRSLAERSGGVFPTASDGAEVTWDTDYFH